MTHQMQVRGWLKPILVEFEGKLTTGEVSARWFADMLLRHAGCWRQETELLIALERAYQTLRLGNCLLTAFLNRGGSAAFTFWRCHRRMQLSTEGFFEGAARVKLSRTHHAPAHHRGRCVAGRAAKRLRTNPFSALR